ncbi:hypothetical protein GOP47_0024248 [Adiantum capillus-veneris]|uniref:Uncharacterized protein n=1 Tax=Adiantum capillus-veneris TaxID=13818 RepID=A0A9D4U681_ADICA|nr:hypothetical protein GOP47_0024248 [Adiantum capillus-veneris]
MEATGLGLRLYPLPSTSPAAASFSRRLRLSQTLLRRPRLFSHNCARIFASAAEESEDEESAGPSRSIGLSADDLEQRLGKRRRSRKEKPNADSVDPKPPPKDWESMTLAEKAWEIYVGEKGALFWLNKIAYAAIFVIVGGWIAFRFVGPALNLYQLDSPLLPPTEVLSGSSK